MIKKLKIIYAGTPDFAVPPLKALLDSQHDVVAVYTQPDRPSGRGRKLTFGPVKQVAVDAGIPVEQTTSLKTAEAQKTLSDYNADVMVVAAYSLLLPQAVLDIPKYGCLNIHASLLPRWRGAAPIQRAIQAGDRTTGVTIMQMAAGLDTGDMLHKISIPIGSEEGAQTIHDRLSIAGADGLMTVLDQLCHGILQPEAQNDALSTYAYKLTKQEGEIDWTQTAKDIDASIRAFDAWPTAYTHYLGKPLKFLKSTYDDHPVLEEPGQVIAESKEGIEIATGEGCVRIKALQMPGGKRMNVADFLNARSLAGETFPS